MGLFWTNSKREGLILNSFTCIVFLNELLFWKDYSPNQNNVKSKSCDLPLTIMLLWWRRRNLINIFLGFTIGLSHFCTPELGLWNIANNPSGSSRLFYSYDEDLSFRKNKRVSVRTRILEFLEFKVLEKNKFKISTLASELKMN